MQNRSCPTSWIWFIRWSKTVFLYWDSPLVGRWLSLSCPYIFLYFIVFLRFNYICMTMHFYCYLCLIISSLACSDLGCLMDMWTFQATNLMSSRASLVASNSNWNVVFWLVKLSLLYLTVRNKVCYYLLLLQLTTTTFGLNTSDIIIF